MSRKFSHFGLFPKILSFLMTGIAGGRGGHKLAQGQTESRMRSDIMGFVALPPGTDGGIVRHYDCLESNESKSLSHCPITASVLKRAELA